MKIGAVLVDHSSYNDCKKTIKQFVLIAMEIVLFLNQKSRHSNLTTVDLRKKHSYLTCCLQLFRNPPISFFALWENACAAPIYEKMCR